MQWLLRSEKFVNKANRTSLRRLSNNDATSQEREVTMMLRDGLCTVAYLQYKPRFRLNMAAA